jgi:hypothetical protein
MSNLLMMRRRNYAASGLQLGEVVEVILGDFDGMTKVRPERLTLRM